MAIRIRRLTAREHSLSAAILSLALTFLTADTASPCSARLSWAGHPTAASFETAFPFIVLVWTLLVLIPRTGNESRIAFFRFCGRFPLLCRYFAVALPFVGIENSIEAYFGFR